MFLGVDDNTGIVYEGVGSSPERPIFPIPMLSQANVIKNSSDWESLPAGYRISPQTWIFREDGFDAVTRTRRGRLYQAIAGASYPQHGTRVMPHPFEDPGGRMTGRDGKLQRPLNVYAACTDLLQQPDRGVGSTLALGNSNSSSAWRIVDVEISVTDDVLVTLKALSAFGMLPSLDEDKVPIDYREEVVGAARRVLDSAFRESPSSVVEHCRDALQMMVTRWLAASGDGTHTEKELAKAAAVIESAPFDKRCVAHLSRIVAMLHGKRGKTSQRLANGVRALTEEDAELCVHAVGFTMRDLGWAKD